MGNENKGASHSHSWMSLGVLWENMCIFLQGRGELCTHRKDYGRYFQKMATPIYIPTKFCGMGHSPCEGLGLCASTWNLLDFCDFLGQQQRGKVTLCDLWGPSYNVMPPGLLSEKDCSQ